MTGTTTDLNLPTATDSDNAEAYLTGAGASGLAGALETLAGKYNPTTGHAHTGAAGDGPKIGLSGLATSAGFGAWTDWVPTAAQNAGLTVTVVYARYLVLGKTLFLQARLDITSAGTANNAIQVSLPGSITPLQNGADQVVGSGLYVDAGAETIPLVVVSAGSNLLKFYRGYGTGLPGDFLGTTGGQGPTAANGDVLSFMAVFELA